MKPADVKPLKPSNVKHDAPFQYMHSYWRDYGPSAQWLLRSSFMKFSVPCSATVKFYKLC